MIRTLVMLVFWGLCTLIVGPIMMVHAFVTKNILPLYRVGMTLGMTGVRVAGIKIEVRGLENIDRSRGYIYMSNHASNLDPPVFVPNIPSRCSVFYKKEVSRVPIFGAVLKMADMVPVDRHNREAAIESVHAAAAVVKRGLSMVVFPEGTRSRDGRLLPFKKGVFHLAMEAGVPIIPVTLLGTHECWPKGSFASHGGTTTVIFHPPIETSQFSEREALMTAVRDAIASALPEDRRG